MTKCEFYYFCDQATEECQVYDFEPDYKDRKKCGELRKKWLEHRKKLPDWEED